MNDVFTKLTVSQQVTRKMRAQIEAGVWEAGVSMPSLRSLADQFDVSLSTVQKAMRELGAMDLIHQRPGQSGVVKSVPRQRPASHRQVAWVEGYDSEAVPGYWGEEIMRAARGVLAREGIRLTILTYQYREPDFAGQVLRLLEPIVGEIAGVYCPSIAPLLPVIEYIGGKGLPWMTVSPAQASIKHNYIAADNLGAGRMAGRCLARLGVERLAVLHFGLDELSPLNKIAGVCQGYLEQELPPPAIDLVRCRDQESRSGHEAMEAYLKDHEPPQGIFATGDWLAVGAIRAAQERGLRVPEDVNVIGSTGIPSSRLLLTPTLATVAQPVRQLGERIAAGLIRMMHEEVSRAPGEMVPCRFIPGQSINAPESMQEQWADDGIGSTANGDVLNNDNSVGNVIAGTSF